MNQFIIASHSTFAKGLANAVRFFDSSTKNLHFLDAYIDGATDFEQNFLNLLNKLEKDDIIVLTDLPGGSVNRIVCSHIAEYNLRVISGVNLPLILELVLKQGPIDDADINQTVSRAREQLVFMNAALQSDKDEGDELDD